MVLHLPALNFHCGFLPANLVYPVDTGCIFHAAVDHIGWNSEHCHFNNAVVISAFVDVLTEIILAKIISK